MNNKQEKSIKIIKSVAIVFVIIYFAFFLYSMSNDTEKNYFWIIYISTSLFAIGFPIILIVYGLKAGKGYRKNLMLSKSKRKFMYLDSFYYIKTIHHGGSDGSLITKFIVYHIIQDLDSNEIYAIGESNTNALFQKVFENTKLLRNDNIDGFSTRKDWKEINYNDEGLFWIDEKLVGYYQNDGNIITIQYYGKKDKIKLSEMFNRNPNYDITLLDNATFITGYVEF